MKDTEHDAPIVKYGMMTDETDRMVERHFDLMNEHQNIAAGVLDHNLRIACIATALLDGQAAPDAPPSMPTALPVEPVSNAPHDWRAKLGLS